MLSTYGTEVSNLEISKDFGLSDHSVIQFTVNVNASIPKNSKYMRNLSKADWNLFQHLLLSTSREWESALTGKNIDLVWGIFVIHVISALDKVAPYKKVSYRSLSSSPRVRTALRHKRRSYHDYCCCPSTANWILYERAKLIAENVLKPLLI